MIRKLLTHVLAVMFVFFGVLGILEATSQDSTAGVVGSFAVMALGIAMELASDREEW